VPSNEVDNRADVFKVVKIRVEVTWVVTPWSIVIGYERFVSEGHPASIRVKMEAGSPKRWYPTALHGITSQETST